MKKVIVLLIIMLFLVMGCGNVKEESKIISYEEVNEIIKNYEKLENVYIIDVREESEFNEGHLIHAYNIPLGIINTIKDEIVDFDSKIIVYCRSGSRSKNAQEILSKLGYTNVYDMGGIINWPYDL